MTPLAPAVTPLDVARIRADFPILRRQVRNKPLVYLDNAATTQKPQVVLDALAHYYTDINANVHRGVHELSGLATDAYEGAREKIRAFFNAARGREGSLPATRPKASIWLRSRSSGRSWRRATKCSSRRWSTTRTSCRGRSSARSAARA